MSEKLRTQEALDTNYTKSSSFDIGYRDIDKNTKER